MASGSGLPTEVGDVNPVWLAQSRFRRRRFDECIEICTKILERNPYDQVRIWLANWGTRMRIASPLGFRVDLGFCASLLQAVWYLKCRALTLKNWIDDTEIEEEVGDLHAAHMSCPQPAPAPAFASVGLCCSGWHIWTAHALACSGGSGTVESCLLNTAQLRAAL